MAFTLDVFSVGRLTRCWGWGPSCCRLPLGIPGPASDFQGTSLLGYLIGTP